MSIVQPSSPGVPHLRRALSFRDLLLYGIIVLSPVAPLTFFGVLTQRSNGHAATTILIAMFAMLLTAISYGRMARAYPSAGSTFTYVGREISPALGYIAGWSVAMDYMVSPLINIIWCGQQAKVFVPEIPYWVWATCFAMVFIGLTSQGVKTSARVNIVLTVGMGIVVVIFLVAAAIYIYTHPHGGVTFYTRPFYDPKTWSLDGILGGTSLAVLTYLGFDSISTLSEESKNPCRDIPLATVLTCAVIGILSVIEVYAAQLVWPATEPYPNLDTAFTFVAQRVWAPLFGVLGLTLIIACLGSGMAAHMGAARLLYGMGRSGALPPSFFGALDPKRQVPRNNVFLVGAIALGGALLLPYLAVQMTGYELACQLQNFGALVAFMGVNAAAFARYYWRATPKKVINFAQPVLGFSVCLILWWNLREPARVVGGIWMVIGIAIGALRTRGFRDNLIIFDLPA